MKKILQRIAIIGFGNMGKAIFSGLISSGNFKKEDFLLSNAENNNVRAAKDADIIILAVKPEAIFGVLGDLKECLTKDKLLISVAARTSVSDIQQSLGFNCPVVRVMPNICASVGESMSCWVKSSEVSVSQAKKVKTILKSIGEEIMLSDEIFFSAVTVISGSGPAYFLYLAELFCDFSREINLESELSIKLIKQTFLGVAKMLSESDKSIQSLRKEIASKGGTTEAVFNFLNKKKFGEIFLKALSSGYKRASGGTKNNSAPKKAAL